MHGNSYAWKDYVAFSNFIEKGKKKERKKIYLIGSFLCVERLCRFFQFYRKRKKERKKGRKEERKKERKEEGKKKGRKEENMFNRILCMEILMHIMLLFSIL